MDLKKAFLKDFKLWLWFVATGSRQFANPDSCSDCFVGVNDNKYLINSKLSKKNQ